MYIIALSLFVHLNATVHVQRQTPMRYMWQPMEDVNLKGCGTHNE